MFTSHILILNLILIFCLDFFFFHFITTTHSINRSLHPIPIPLYPTSSSPISCPPHPIHSNPIRPVPIQSIPPKIK
jgi:hypothetical protein